MRVTSRVTYAKQPSGPSRALTPPGGRSLSPPKNAAMILSQLVSLESLVPRRHFVRRLPWQTPSKLFGSRLRKLSIPKRRWTARRLSNPTPPPRVVASITVSRYLPRCDKLLWTTSPGRGTNHRPYERRATGAPDVTRIPLPISRLSAAAWTSHRASFFTVCATADRVNFRRLG